MYRHYSGKHYGSAIREVFGPVPAEGKECPFCSKHLPRKHFVEHLGAVEGFVDCFLPEEFHMPQGSARRRYSGKVAKKRDAGQE